MKSYLGYCCCLCLGLQLLFQSSYGQNIEVTQTLRGTVFDQATQQVLVGASIKIEGTDPVLGAISDEKGQFIIESVPVGRYEIEVSYLGYKSQRKSSVLLTSGQETILQIGMEEQALEGEVVYIEADQRKVTNEAAMVSARSFSVEELRRIPGGLDDPARVAVKFPGVAPNGDVRANALTIRGNSPNAVLWRLEGVDIYNPNHFTQVGNPNGSITLFSQQLLTNTDFFSGAFPADYGNVLGGVFDARFRNGNTQKRQHALQLSLLGLDVATEGPFTKAGNSSYLVNYRYSTTGLVNNFLDLGFAIPTYQDLSFKLHFQLPKAGVIDIFGIGGISRLDYSPNRDTTRWGTDPLISFGGEYITTTGTIGATYAQPIGEKTFFKTALVGTGLDYDVSTYYLNRDLVTADSSGKTDDRDLRLTWSTYINHKFSARHTHRTGINIHGLRSNMQFVRPENFWAIQPGGPLTDTVRAGQGQSLLINAYSRSQFALSTRWNLNVGLHLMYFAYTGEVSLEPRLGMRFQISPQQSLSFGYGLHSQMEPFFTYIIERTDAEGNKYRFHDDLRFSKAHHFVLAYRWQPTDKLRFGLEVYHQEQFNLVVGEELPISRVGGADYFFETFDLNNNGTGRNTGIEVAIERSFSNGYYFLVNGSFFDASYIANDGVSRPSEFNTGLIGKGIFGKEWMLGQKKGKANTLNLNFSATYSGPRYFTPQDIELARTSGVLQLDYNRPNTEVQDALLFFDASLVYQRNLLKRSSQFSIQVRNIFSQRPLLRQIYDRETDQIVDVLGSGLFPVIGWKIQF
ncbi:MAG: TonB-dependent receptor [Bacteroidota bacterium]